MAAKILSDHIKKNKVLIPPMNYLLNTQDANYGRGVIPEIIWIDFILEAYGFRQTVNIIEAFTAGLKSVTAVEQPLNCCIISCYEKLSDDDKMRFLQHPRVKDVLEDVRNILGGFKQYFPDIPINFILTNQNAPKDLFVNDLKQALTRVFNPKSTRTIHALACIFYAQSYAGHLVISDEIDRFDLNEITKYPDTEESKRVAAIVSTSAKTFITIINMGNSAIWPNYFWDKCYELEPCKINHLTNSTL
ncbi:hypothetical protein [Rikenella microfusus]